MSPTATNGHPWSFIVTYANLWSLMVTLHPWSRLVTYDHPTSMVICHPWSPLIAHGHLTPSSSAIYGHPAGDHLSPMATNGHPWSSVTMVTSGHLLPMVTCYLGSPMVTSGQPWSLSIQGHLSLLVTHSHLWSPLVTQHPWLPVTHCHPWSLLVTLHVCSLG